MGQWGNGIIYIAERRPDDGDIQLANKLGVETEGYRKILCQTGGCSSRDMSESTESYLRNEKYAASVVWCVMSINKRLKLLNNTSYLYMI